MAADGKSFITSVGTTDSSIWFHNEKGDQALTSEGDTFEPTFSSDGRRIYYLKRQWTYGQRGSMGHRVWLQDRARDFCPGYGVEGGYYPKLRSLERWETHCVCDAG